MSYGKIGQRLGRIEGPAKVTGEAKYTADILLPGMIWGKVLRSPLPHAKIVAIDTREAEQMPGILAVLTAKDLPDLLTGRLVYDMPVLAIDRVRFIGEKVAVVAAEDPDMAEDALASIDVEYEEMPAVFDAHEAMNPEAPLLHPDYRSYAHAPEKFFSDIPNVHSHVTWELGDIDKGFALAKQVFEHTFSTPAVHQGYIEPHASVVAIDPDGRVNVWISNKMPVRARELLADVIELPEERIVVHLAQIGADFGGKGSLMDAPLCYHLAKRTGRPVKMVMSYTEELMAGNPRHPTSIFLRTGVTEEGQIVARQAKVVFNSGAYAAFKPVPFVNIPGAKDAAGVYGTPHIRIDAYSVYANCVPSGHFRAPGDLQVNFAVESSMDMIAEDLGLDRLEFRKQNLLKDGDWVPGGPQLEEVRVAETLAAAVKASSWNQPKSQPNRGLGLAVSHRLIGTGEANTQLTLKEDGTIQVLTPVPEVGTGAHTILQQIVAETLFLPLDQVRVETATEIFKTDSGSGASRVTYVGGQVVQQAAGELMKLILAAGAKGLGCAENEVVFEGGRVVRSDSDGSLSLVEVAKLGGDGKSALRVKKLLNLSEGPPMTTFTAQVVELEVDPETGQIRLLDVVTAHDVGTIINPLGHQGQIEGGLLQGVGFGLLEELRIEDGQVSTLNLGDYKLPNIRDIPPLTTVLVEEELGPAPFHGKAIGESSITPTGAAIANAVYDAVGVRFHDLPINAEKVYWALQQHRGGKG
ncbi:MAG: xanthine dehydrogenase family protein molybdopterin-binding subunit [Acidobacteriota bacterium]